MPRGAGEREMKEDCPEIRLFNAIFSKREREAKEKTEFELRRRRLPAKHGGVRGTNIAEGASGRKGKRGGRACSPR